MFALASDLTNSSPMCGVQHWVQHKVDARERTRILLKRPPNEKGELVVHKVFENKARRGISAEGPRLFFKGYLVNGL